MATKTISLELDAYEKLKTQKKPGESFSAVVRRAEFGYGNGMTGREILETFHSGEPGFTEQELDDMEEACLSDQPPDNPWSS